MANKVFALILGLLVILLSFQLVLAENSTVEANETEDNETDTCEGVCQPPTCEDYEILEEEDLGECCPEYECKEVDHDENETDNDKDKINKTKRGLGQYIRGRVRAGEVTLENGETVRVRELAQNRMELLFGEIRIETELEIEEETENGTSKLKVKMKNGLKKEIKIMPETARQRALERLRLRVCSEENNCTIELKEVGKNKQLAYELQIKRHSKILGIFKTKMKVQAQVDAENGEVIKIKKPWWAFIASEPEE